MRKPCARVRKAQKRLGSNELAGVAGIAGERFHSYAENVRGDIL